jgi:hypothetical protein
MVFVPAYWIANMKISTTKAFLIVLLGFILWPMKPYLIIGGWLNSLSTDTLAKDAFNSYSALYDAGFSLTEYVKIILLIIIFINDKYILSLNVPNYMKVRNLIIAFYFFYYAFHGNVIFSVRLPANYQVFEIILIPMIVFYSRYRLALYAYYVLFVYLISWRFWVNAQSLGFNKFSTIFNNPSFNMYYFTPHKFADDKNSKDDNVYQIE